ncbi:tyrosine protein phosphatase [Halobacillus salinus]|uniref:Tyrosine-protein phosphatase n=1 Tax=Halobacillus salinus TaxID=192814 RepID=A0A4Z0GXK0_9BACI|nr:CpsB/CapC family capsule biosynthesis tyrosine phosphatase [Halobacillus salinus]TGB02520.1 tyrosine protein phosphatase [Halobacillus salinus]
MIDIHCHILPGVDDGALSVQDSIDMAREAEKEGIDIIVATPHHMNGTYENTKQEILKKVDYLNEVFKDEGIDIHILPGQETRINGEMLEAIKAGDVLPLNNTRYVFVELPFSNIPRYTSKLLFDLQVSGYCPIIVHPERNKRIQEDPDILYSFVEKGCYTQITAASLIGKFGKKNQKVSRLLIEANLAHLISSDAHNTTSRGFKMQEAYNEIEKRYGFSMVRFFQENADYLIENHVLAAQPPQQVKKKIFLGLF